MTLDLRPLGKQEGGAAAEPKNILMALVIRMNGIIGIGCESRQAVTIPDYEDQPHPVGPTI